MTKLYMFTTTHCTKCPSVKEALTNKGIEVEIIDAEETPELAMKFMIMSVPSIVNVSEDKVETYWGSTQCLEFVDEL